jgi:isoquinoline 1-oxidoreductase alpha subunit
VAYRINVNGRVREADVEPGTPLLWTLRDALGILGPKFGCGVAQCGACTVHIDGVAVRSCSFPVESVGQSKVVTIEGLGPTPMGRKLQAAWSELDVAQCGYCQPGQIMSAAALLAAKPRPTDADIDASMTNICRCATYTRIRAAVKRASGQKSEA